MGDLTGGGDSKVSPPTDSEEVAVEEVEWEALVMCWPTLVTRAALEAFYQGHWATAKAGGAIAVICIEDAAGYMAAGFIPRMDREVRTAWLSRPEWNAVRDEVRDLVTEAGADPDKDIERPELQVLLNALDRGATTLYSAGELPAVIAARMC